jgi:hypothetical protein
MIKKTLYIIITLFFISCSHTIDKKEVIRKIVKDNLTVISVDLVQESNFYNVISDIENSVNSSKEAWKKAPELNRTFRLSIIDEVSKKYLKNLKEKNFLNDDKVIAYRFIKTDQSKKYIGYAVILFHEQNQHTLYYEIHSTPYDYYPTMGVKQLINKGLINEINKIDEANSTNSPANSDNI